MKSADDYNEGLRALYREVESDFGAAVIRNAFDWTKSSQPFGKLREISEDVNPEYAISGLFATVIPLLIFCATTLGPQAKLEILRTLKKGTEDVINRIERGERS